MNATSLFSSFQPCLELWSENLSQIRPRQRIALFSCPALKSLIHRMSHLNWIYVSFLPPIPLIPFPSHHNDNLPHRHAAKILAAPYSCQRVFRLFPPYFHSLNRCCLLPDKVPRSHFAFFFPFSKSFLSEFSLSIILILILPPFQFSLPLSSFLLLIIVPAPNLLSPPYIAFPFPLPNTTEFFITPPQSFFCAPPACVK